MLITGNYYHNVYGSFLPLYFNSELLNHKAQVSGKHSIPNVSTSLHGLNEPDCLLATIMYWQGHDSSGRYLSVRMLLESVENDKP